MNLTQLEWVKTELKRRRYEINNKQDFLYQNNKLNLTLNLEVGNISNGVCTHRQCKYESNAS